MEFPDKTNATDSYDFEQSVFELWTSASSSLNVDVGWE